MKSILFIIILSFVIIPDPSQANFAAGYCVDLSAKRRCEEKSEKLEKENKELKEKIKELEEQVKQKENKG